MSSVLDHQLSALTLYPFCPPPTELRRHRSITRNPSLTGLEVLLTNMPPDLTDTIFLALTFGDALALRQVNRNLAQSYAINSILRQPFRGRRLGGSCQAEVVRDWSKTREPSGGNREYELYVLESRPEHSHVVCGNGPHNGHITRYCESHTAHTSCRSPGNVLEQRSRPSHLYEVCEKHRGTEHATGQSAGTQSFDRSRKNIPEWMPVCESCTMCQIARNPRGSNSCCCEAAIASDEALLAQGWNCEGCVHRQAQSYALKAIAGFMKILLGRAMPGSTVEEMQAALGGVSGLGDETVEMWRQKYGIGEWFTCPLCGEVRPGDLGVPPGQVPLVELCLVCGGIFYASAGSEEARKRSKW